MGLRRKKDPDKYDREDVEMLLGLYDGWGPRGPRHVTVADLLTWFLDPGGPNLYLRIALRAGEDDAWMAKRGPLLPHGELAAVLFDFRRAMRRLDGVARAVIGLTAMNFEPVEVLEVVKLDLPRRPMAESERREGIRRVHRILRGRCETDGEGDVLLFDQAAMALTAMDVEPAVLLDVLTVNPRRQRLSHNQRRDATKRVHRMLRGRPKLDESGQRVKDATTGRVVRVGGLVAPLTRAMNGADPYPGRDHGPVVAREAV